MTGQSNPTCPQCRSEFSSGVLVCNQCFTLVHQGTLEKLSAEARVLEEEQQIDLARQQWLKALELLPADTKQAEWIRTHLRKLELDDRVTIPQKPKHVWLRKLGPLAPILILLFKNKAIFAFFNLKFLTSLLAFSTFYLHLYGFSFGIGFAALILIHEMGHFIHIRWLGLPADMPIFLPGLGAYVRWHALNVTKETQAAISLSGPFAGCLASAACVFAFRSTGNVFWVGLAQAGIVLNLLNLIPVWVLDGGKATEALDKAQRWFLLAVCVVLWLFLGQDIFFLVGAGFAYRLFTKDFSEEPSKFVAQYYFFLLVCSGLLFWMLHTQ